MYYVYRYMLNDQWIYVGKAAANNTRDELQNRIRSHSKDKRFSEYHNASIEYCIFEHKSDMDIVETMLIKIHKPLINVVSKTDVELPFIYDPSQIIWHDFESFTRYRKEHDEEIQLDKVKHLILEYFKSSNPTCSFRKYGLFDNELVVLINHTICDYVESNASENYPYCEAEFEINYKDILNRIDYRSDIKPSALSRKLKDAIKEIFPSNKKDFWMVTLQRNKDMIHFHVHHIVYAYSDCLWQTEHIASSLLPQNINAKEAM